MKIEEFHVPTIYAMFGSRKLPMKGKKNIKGNDFLMFSLP